MSQLNKSQLEHIISEGYSFKFGDYINKGFELFGKNAGGFIGFTLIYFVMQGISQGVDNPFVSLTVSLVSIAITVGFYLVAHRILREEPFEFNDFFGGFKHFGTLLGMTIVSSVIYVMSLIPFGAIAFLVTDISSISAGVPPENIGLLIGILFLAMLPILYLAVSWMFAPLLIVFHGLDFWESLETSRKIVAKNWWSFLGFSLVVGLINLGGLLALLVGVLVTVPSTACALYVAFADITGLNEERNEEEYIMDHLVD